MKRFFKAVLACFMLTGGGIAAADSKDAGVTGDALRNAEARGLRGVSKTRLDDLLSAPTAARDVSFTRSWIDAQPKAKGGAHWKCLSEALYFEARGETVKGQFAVAEVIMNRVRSARFPDNVCGVINQGTGKRYQCQFTYTCDGYAEVIAEPRAWEMVGKVARLAMDGAAGVRPLCDSIQHHP